MSNAESHIKYYAMFIATVKFINLIKYPKQFQHLRLISEMYIMYDINYQNKYCNQVGQEEITSHTHHKLVSLLLEA
jgi:hypothetical protein